MSANGSFRLAPMSPLFRVLTYTLLPVPLFMAAMSLYEGVLIVLAPTALFMAGIYAIVYFYMRPRRFELDDHELRVVFPLRTLTIGRGKVTRAEMVSWAQFTSRYPRPIRMGAGGLWGGFGKLLTKSGMVQFYISRQDQLVLLEFDGRRPLLITPDNPANFVAAMRHVTE